MEYRSIGPFRGGRSAAVTGVNGRPFLSINEQLIEPDRIMNSQLPAFNELVRQAGVPAVQVP